MNNTIKLVAAAGTVIAVYKSLECGINRAVEQYLPEQVAKNFPTPLVAGGLVLAAVGATVSHPAIAGTVLFVNSSVESVQDQIRVLGRSLNGLTSLMGTLGLHELIAGEYKSAAVQLTGNTEYNTSVQVIYTNLQFSWTNFIYDAFFEYHH